MDPAPQRSTIAAAKAQMGRSRPLMITLLLTTALLMAMIGMGTRHWRIANSSSVNTTLLYTTFNQAVESPSLPATSTATATPVNTSAITDHLQVQSITPTINDAHKSSSLPSPSISSMSDDDATDAAILAAVRDAGFDTHRLAIELADDRYHTSSIISPSLARAHRLAARFKRDMVPQASYGDGDDGGAGGTVRSSSSTATRRSSTAATTTGGTTTTGGGGGGGNTGIDNGGGNSNTDNSDDYPAVVLNFGLGRADLWPSDSIAVVDLPDSYDTRVARASNAMLALGIIGVLLGFCVCRSTLYLATGTNDSIITWRGVQLHSFIFVSLTITSILFFMGLICYAAVWPDAATFPYHITYATDYSLYLMVVAAFITMVCAIWVWRFYQLQLPPRFVAGVHACAARFACCLKCIPKGYQCPTIRNVRQKVATLLVTLSLTLAIAGLVSAEWTLANNGDSYGLAQATISDQTIYLYSDSRAPSSISYVSSRTALIAFGGVLLLFVSLICGVCILRRKVGGVIGLSWMTCLTGSLCLLIAICYYAANFPRASLSSSATYGYSFALVTVAFILSFVAGFAFCPPTRQQGQVITAWV